MADKYRKGEHYLICDRSGRQMRASESRREWTGAVVHKDEYEARHPQDFVRARPERQAVAISRSPQIDRYMGPLTTRLTADTEAGSNTLVVETTVRFEAGDRVNLILENSDTWSAIVSAVLDTESLALAASLPRRAVIGATLVNLTAVAAANIG